MTISHQLEQRLRTELEPTFLEVVNESHMHSVPMNSETHFKVTLVSNRFSETRKVARHRMVYALVPDLFEGELHALALHTYTPEEWAMTSAAPLSPSCRGGSKAS